MFKSSALLAGFEEIGILNKVHEVYTSNRSLKILTVGNKTLFYCSNEYSKTATLSYVEGFDQLEELLACVETECRRAVLAAKLQGSKLENHTNHFMLKDFKVDMTINVMPQETTKIGTIPQTKRGINVRWLQLWDDHLCSIKVVLTSHK